MINIDKIIKKSKFQLWSLHKDQFRKEHKLYYLFWECTLNCNLFCKHCGSSAGGKKIENELKAEEIKKAFQSIAEDFNPKEIMIAVTGGEPLIRKDVFEVMKFAHKLGFSWGMVSNGFLINSKIIEKMADSGMESISISIDGDEKIHDEFRGVKGSYKKAIEAIKLLIKNKDIKLTEVVTSVHSENIDQLQKMYETFILLGVKFWRLMNVDPIGRASENKNILLQKNQINKLLNFIKEKRKEKKIEISYACAGFLGYDFEGEVREKYFFCQSGINIGSILYDGDIYVCPDVPRIKELIQGNIKIDKFSDIWNNKFKFFRNKDRTKCEKCFNCEYWEQCGGGALHSWDFEKNEPKVCYSEDKIVAL